MTDDAIAYQTKPASDPQLPMEVAASAEAAGAVEVAEATRAGKVVAYAVASPDLASVEVLHVADPDSVRVEGIVIAAARFRMDGDRLFHDRYRFSPLEDQDPRGRVHFCETVFYREPDQIVHVEEYVSGTVTEHVFERVDVSGKYVAVPERGQWDALVTFPGT